MAWKAVNSKVKDFFKCAIKTYSIDICICIVYIHLMRNPEMCVGCPKLRELNKISDTLRTGAAAAKETIEVTQRLRDTAMEEADLAALREELNRLTGEPLTIAQAEHDLRSAELRTGMHDTYIGTHRENRATADMGDADAASIDRLRNGIEQLCVNGPKKGLRIPLTSAVIPVGRKEQCTSPIANNADGLVGDARSRHPQVLYKNK
jgi:hypothetical protein